jgi:hypothetical protein
MLGAARLVGGDPTLRRLLTVLVVDDLLYGWPCRWSTGSPAPRSRWAS